MINTTITCKNGTIYSTSTKVKSSFITFKGINKQFGEYISNLKGVIK